MTVYVLPVNSIKLAVCVTYSSLIDVTTNKSALNRLTLSKLTYTVNGT
jgi:hypothetical protein